MNIKLSIFQEELIANIEGRGTFTKWYTKLAEQFDIWDNYVYDPNVDPVYHVIDLTWVEGTFMHTLRAGSERLFDDETHFELTPNQQEQFEGIQNGTLNVWEVFAAELIEHLCANPDEEDEVTEDEAKASIVAYVTAHEDKVSNEFEPPEDMKPAMEIGNWDLDVDFDGGENADGSVTVLFNCEPYDDQLRAYVTISPTAILNVEVTGE